MSKYVPAFSPGAIAERKTWQYRAISYAQGAQSRTGAFLLAVLGRKVKPPYIHTGGAKIKPNGNVVVLYKKDDRSPVRPEVVYVTVEGLNMAFRGLAEAIKADDAETEAMFSEIRKFIIRDERATSNLG